ncbi:MAG: DNA polymerase III subunit gamma/tau [Oscillospiraceae bacterium]|nr:DNA polymerase III subunit gamma/tau [Oscillospiraceae bacterium]
MYKALYRKYRPGTFDDVIGQEHITSTLRNQVLMGRLSHAYLFVGTRGTGKTTCAKILSKAVNCHHPVDGNPCNACPSCLGINTGSILDVVELDAASNNGVENIRAIRDEAVYTPSEVKKRVYIVDEVHMLSTAAFNALLKILEEPPEHLIFILATTELHKVPATILSRCQRFSFKRITAEDISQRLDYVAEQEGIDLTKEASMMLARLADGSMRDGLSLMDQCRSAQRIDEAQVISCIGLSGAEETSKLLKCVEKRDTSSALEILDGLYMAGKDPGGVLNELSSMMRDIMVMRMASKSGESLISGTFPLSMLRGYRIPTEKLVWCMKTLQTALTELDRSPDRRTSAELCLIRLTNENLFTDTEALAARISVLEDRIANGVVAAAPAPAEKLSEPEAIEDVEPDEVVCEPDIEEPEEAPSPEADEEPALEDTSPESTGNDVKWRQILGEIDPAKAGLLNGFTPIFGDGQITVNTGPGFVYILLNRPDNLSMLEAAATKVMGVQTRVTITDKASDAPGTDKLDNLRKFGNIKFE